MHDTNTIGYETIFLLILKYSNVSNIFRKQQYNLLFCPILFVNVRFLTTQSGWPMAMLNTGSAGISDRHARLGPYYDLGIGMTRKFV